MALEPVKLDDLTWSGMTESIRNRIAAVSGGQWTLHAPVDPGVTLIELFAWLLEQRVFWMDQRPNALVRACLKLMGADLPAAAGIATTVLQLKNGEGQAQNFPQIAALRELTPVGIGPAARFTLPQNLTLLPCESVTVKTGSLDRTTELNAGRVIRLFPADGSAAEVSLLLKLSEPIPQPAPAFPLSLLLELQVPKAIAPQWSVHAVSVRAPTAVRWQYRKTDGTLADFAEVEDGTLGMRRSGLVRLKIPEDWAQAGLNTYPLFISVEKAQFSFPPRLVRLVINGAIARHQRQTKTHELKLNWLPLPGQTLDLSRLSTGDSADLPPLVDGFELNLKERDGQFQQWMPTEDFSFHGPADRVFRIDRELGQLRFGDGLNGRIPVLSQQDGSANVRARYWVGGGSGGNIGSPAQWLSQIDEAGAGAPPALIFGQSLIPASEGLEPETLDHAAERASSLINQIERAVIAKDYVELALETPGIAVGRAHAALGFHPRLPCYTVQGTVAVFIVPQAPREREDTDWSEQAYVPAPMPDAGALAEVQARLDRARLAGSEVFVLPPRYRPVNLAVRVETSSRVTSQLQLAIDERLRTFLDPLVGGDNADGWPFGEPLRPSALLREAQEAVGEAGSVLEVSIQLLDRDSLAQNCHDVPIGSHDLVELKTVTVSFNRHQPTREGLR